MTGSAAVADYARSERTDRRGVGDLAAEPVVAPRAGRPMTGRHAVLVDAVAAR